VNRLSFNPMRLPHGIEPSGDPILHARGEIYAMACGERSGLRCPMHSGNGRAT
jgi:catalase